MRTTRVLVLSAAAMLALPLTTHAQFPIAPPGSEGFQIIVGSADPIIATYQGNSASFTNLLYLMLDGFGNPGDDGDLGNDMFLFNNQTSPIGSTVNLGSFAPGTELIFRLFVTNTGDNWLTGPGSRNADGLPHARAQSNWMPDETLVSFEDLYGLPEGANGYNDLSFSFTNTRALTATPEPATFGLLALGLACIAGVRRRRGIA